MLTPTFANPAAFITYNILHLRRGTALAQGAKVFLTFFISGLLHLSVDVAGRIPWQVSGSLRFFCMQAFGIVVETVVQVIATRSLTPANNRPDNSPRFFRWDRVIGYIWTAAFLVWTTPAYSYPAIQEDAESADKTKLPFSIIKSVYPLSRAGL